MTLKKVTSIMMAVLAAASLAGCGEGTATNSQSGEPVRLIDASEMFSSKDIESGYDVTECTAIALNGAAASVSGDGASAKGSTVTISAEGDYLFSGRLDDGAVVIDAGKKDKVRLIFDGVEITGSTCAIVNVKQADKVLITLAKGSENVLSNADNAAVSDNADAVIFSKDDLTINGEGSLTVTAHTGHGIVSKDDLVISGGTYQITSQKKALDANDSLRVAGGSFTIDSGADALHAENDDAAKGYIYIADGTFRITAGADGMDASGAIQIDNGAITLKTGGGSANASTQKDGQINGGWGVWNGRGRHMSSETDADTKETNLSAVSAASGANTVSSSAKGIKSDSSVAINNGAITIDSSDDAIHSDKDVTISGGAIAIASGDDGIHAGSALQITGGTVTVSKSYEGLEGMTVAISGGAVSVTASDDGINAAGGSDQSSMNGRPGQNKFASQEGVSINVSGGIVKVNASGDGIDSNGDVKVSGGEVYVSGASDNGNAALDFNGDAAVTGGVFVAAGMSGMAQNFGTSSTQGAILLRVQTQQGGSGIILKDSSGKTLVSFQPEKMYDCVVVSAPGIQKGGVYTLQTGSASTSITMESLLYGSGGGMNGMGGRPGGRRGRG